MYIICIEEKVFFISNAIDISFQDLTMNTSFVLVAHLSIDRIQDLKARLRSLQILVTSLNPYFSVNTDFIHEKRSRKLAFLDRCNAMLLDSNFLVLWPCVNIIKKGFFFLT